MSVVARLDLKCDACGTLLGGDYGDYFPTTDDLRRSADKQRWAQVYEALPDGRSWPTDRDTCPLCQEDPTWFTRLHAASTPPQ